LKPLVAISEDGTRIAYEKAGRGQALILVLGALNSRKSGASLAKLLSPRFTVVSYDRRGRGNSTDTGPFSPQREVEDLAALISEVGGPVDLYGHSSGGALAFEAATRLGRLVRKVAVYEVPYSTDSTAVKAAKEYYKTLKAMLASGNSGDAVALFIRSVGVSDKQLLAIKRMPMWRGLERLAPTLAYDSEILGEGHSLPRTLLSRVTNRTLVMHGGKGAISMRDAARAISESIPEAKFRTIPGQTHGVKPKVLAPILAEFFS
jgi:pimeloyl-ACP methyl ester carboxylesterase